MGFAEVLTWFQQWGGLQIGTAVAVGLVTCVALYGGKRLIFGGGAASLEDLTNESGALKTNLNKALSFTSNNDPETNAQDLVFAQQVGTEFTTFHNRFAATFPTLFKEGELVQNVTEELNKLTETTYKGKEEDFTNAKEVVRAYRRLAQKMFFLPKTIEEIANEKTAEANRAALVHRIETFMQVLSKARAYDKKLEEQVVVLQTDADSLGLGEQLQAAFNKMYQQVDALKAGGQSGNNTGTSGTNTGGNTIVSGNNAGTGTNKPTKPITATPPKKKTDKKKGMAWYWWLVIIVGILSVLGAVAYLFLGTDPANDEEYSPEQEA